MGWLEFLLGAALAAGAAYLVVKTVSYFVDRSRLREIMIEQKNEKNLNNVVKSCIKNNDGHECTFDFMDSFNNSVGSGKVSSTGGITKDVQQGDVIWL